MWPREGSASTSDSTLAFCTLSPHLLSAAASPFQPLQTPSLCSSLSQAPPQPRSHASPNLKGSFAFRPSYILAHRPRPLPRTPASKGSSRAVPGGSWAPRHSSVGLQAPLPARSPVARVSVRQGSFVVFWMRGGRARLQHYGAAGHVNGHAGVLDEEVLQGAALEAGRPESRPLCSKTGRRGNKPAFIHQGGCGWRAAGRGSGSPGTGWSCEAVYGLRKEGAQWGDTHTGHNGTGRERALLVSPAAPPATPRGHPQVSTCCPRAREVWTATPLPGESPSLHGRALLPLPPMLLPQPLFALGTPQSPSSSLLNGWTMCPNENFTGSGVSPGSRLTRQVNDEPAIHFILLRDEGLGAVGVLGSRWWGTEEEAGEALKHGGEAKRPGEGDGLWQCRNL